MPSPSRVAAHTTGPGAPPARQATRRGGSAPWREIVLAVLTLVLGGGVTAVLLRTQRSRSLAPPDGDGVVVQLRSVDGDGGDDADRAAA